MMSILRHSRRRLGLLAFALALGLAPAARAQIVEPFQEVAPDGTRTLLQLKFSNAPLDMVLDFYGEHTARTIIKSPALNANITLQSRGRLEVRDALIAIESALAMNNVALVPMGDKFLRAVQIASVRNTGAAIGTSPRAESFPESDELVSQVVDLKYMEYTEVQTVLDQIKSPFAKLIPFERTNSLLITDTAQNLKRMLEVLDYIDRPVAVREDIFVREIKHAKPSEIAAKLNELIQDTQAQQGQQQRGARAAQPAAQPATPAGVIRPARPGQATELGIAPAATAAAANDLTAAELAERGIVQGKVKIVADDRTGVLFILSRPENFAFFDQIIAVLDRPVDPTFGTWVRAMEYADAEETASILNEFIGAAKREEAGGAGAAAAGGQADAPAGGAAARSQALREFVRGANPEAATAVDAALDRLGRVSPDTKILADKRTNSVLLMGSRADISTLLALIDQLDVMLGQVLIEVVILEVRLSNNLSYGIDWLQRSYTAYNEERLGPGNTVINRQPVIGFGGGQRVLGASTPFIDGANVTRDTPLSGALSYYSTFYDLNLDAILQAAASSSDARILSTPVVLTTDNTEASISVGEERPVVTTSSTTDAGTIRSSYEYRNIGINLTVTPRINPARLVVMDIKQTADGIAGTVLIDGNEVPIITKREFSASVAVDSRQTIVLGGLVSTDKSVGRTKIPILGDIPLLGALFRSDVRNSVRTELLVLLTPYVLMDSREARAETARLFESTHTDKVTFQRGWSDSELASEPKSSFFGRKKKPSPASAVPAGEPGDSARPRVTPRLHFSSPQSDPLQSPLVEALDAAPTEQPEPMPVPEPEPAPLPESTPEFQPGDEAAPSGDLDQPVVR